MKLRYILGLSLRMYFGIILYVFPFADFLLFIFLNQFGISVYISALIFIILFIIIGIMIYGTKCPECNTRLIETYRIGSKYYQGGFHKVQEKCPCCGLDLDTV
ncbi:MAG: hypothetical protein IKX23_06975 [Treponema sp.]|nr:hypothetical protein [Treponema sp.]